MLQPFEVLKPDYLDKMIGLGRTWLVTQTYKRALDHFAEQAKIALLVSDYDDPGLAKVHLTAVKTDRYSAIIDLTRPAHKTKILEMLSADSKYRLFWTTVKSRKELEDKINSRYKDQMRKYISAHTNWKINRDTIIKPGLQVTFGELFVTVEYGSQRLRFNFEEIEKL